MPTSLGIMHIFVGPPPPPLPCCACWPTPQDAAIRINVISKSARTPLNPHICLVDTFLPLFGAFCFPSRAFSFSECGSLLLYSEELVEKHGHEQQDAQYEEHPGAGHPGQGKAVAQGGDYQHAEHGAGYGSRAAIDAGPAEDHGGDHVEL